jgi:hypothetical protein
MENLPAAAEAKFDINTLFHQSRAVTASIEFFLPLTDVFTIATR